MAGKPATVRARIDPRLAKQLDELISEGVFAGRSEALSAALSDFLKRRRLTRLRKAVREDIEWGLRGA
ncbi:MAG TPA: ribbon-helix-helix domain-containing protein [Thermoplasmata archaeon]|nr:ribbon-helix-helix domain-containing protein [Thermoplasmata archaeon]